MPFNRGSELVSRRKSTELLDKEDYVSLDSLVGQLKRKSPEEVEKTSIKCQITDCSEPLIDCLSSPPFGYRRCVKVQDLSPNENDNYDVFHILFFGIYAANLGKMDKDDYVIITKPKIKKRRIPPKSENRENDIYGYEIWVGADLGEDGSALNDSVITVIPKPVSIPPSPSQSSPTRNNK